MTRVTVITIFETRKRPIPAEGRIYHLVRDDGLALCPAKPGGGWSDDLKGCTELCEACRQRANAIY